ncbi:hypothetical protein JM49_21095 [Pseudomonas chlororaphis subsp. aurantiaca]|nr:hypothetical protein JM49_21095 [Pseudomonas chlororaphis subsp. aurantiaca]
MLPPAQQADSLFPAAAADFDIGLERTTDGGPFGLAEQTAQQFDRKMDATFSGRFAIGHSGNRGTDGRGNATGATAFTAVHDDKLLATGKVLK